MIQKGDVVRIKKEWQDPGDDKYTWIATCNEEDNHVYVVPIDMGLPILPSYDVPVDMLEVS